MSTLAQSTAACDDFKQDVIKGNIISAQKKLDALKVSTKFVPYFTKGTIKAYLHLVFIRIFFLTVIRCRL